MFNLSVIVTLLIIVTCFIYVLNIYIRISSDVEVLTIKKKHWNSAKMVQIRAKSNLTLVKFSVYALFLVKKKGQKTLFTIS